MELNGPRKKVIRVSRLKKGTQKGKTLFYSKNRQAHGSNFVQKGQPQGWEAGSPNILTGGWKTLKEEKGRKES